MFVVIKMTKNINHTHTTMKDGYVVGLGEALWDVLPDGKKLGGAPANFAYHAGQFGLNAVAVSALGEDKLAEETIAQLEGKHLR